MKSNLNITNIDNARFVVISEIRAKIITLGNDFIYRINDKIAIKVSNLTTNEKNKIKRKQNNMVKNLFSM